MTASAPLSLAASALRRRAALRARSYVSTCQSISKLPSASSVVASSSDSSSSSGSGSSHSSSSASSASSNSNGSSSSGSSGSGSSSSKAAAAQEGKTETAPASFGASNHGSKAKAAPSVKTGVASANPPPTSLASVAYEAFFSNGRPLLQHETLAPRSKLLSDSLLGRTFKASSSVDATASAHGLTTLLTGDGVLAALGSPDSFESRSKWVRRIRGISPERFSQLVDDLSGPKKDHEALATTTGPNFSLESRTSSSDASSRRVSAAAHKLAQEERQREEEEEAVQSALERGEDPETARRLGIEADLIILGEPNGPSAKWSKGVATYLAERGRAYEAPPAPRQEDDSDFDINDYISDSYSNAAPFMVDSVFYTDDDPNLILSHAMVQTTLPLALKWDRLVSQMDAVALGKPEKATEGIDLTKLNATMPKVRAAQREKDAHDVLMDSVRRKRRKKIRKHKYKKLRKEQRAERQRMKK